MHGAAAAKERESWKTNGGCCRKRARARAMISLKLVKGTPQPLAMMAEAD